MDVAIPTAMPDAPLISSMGSRTGRTTGSRACVSNVGRVSCGKQGGKRRREKRGPVGGQVGWARRGSRCRNASEVPIGKCASRERWLVEGYVCV